MVSFRLLRTELSGTLQRHVSSPGRKGPYGSGSWKDGPRKEIPSESLGTNLLVLTRVEGESSIEKGNHFSGSVFLCDSIFPGTVKCEYKDRDEKNLFIEKGYQSPLQSGRTRRTRPVLR